jgi:polyisoprenoid-binding protein YceI
MRTKTTVAALGPLWAAIIVAACRPGEAAVKETTAAVETSTGDVALPATDGLQLTVAPDGNEVRYRVREQLVGVDLPNDAVGATTQVSGGIAFDAAGKLVPASSKFVVNVSTLKSDRDRRDGYVRNRILETNEFPTVELAPTAIRGLALPLPTSGAKSFQLLGNLTVHGVTKPTTWNVDAKFDRNGVTGSASTTFAFADFGLTQPRVPVVLSVADSITLEYTFALAPKQ